MDAVVEFHKDGDKRWIFTTARNVADFLRVAAIAVGQLLEAGLFSGELRYWLALIVKAAQALGSGQSVEPVVVNEGVGPVGDAFIGDGDTGDNTLILRVNIAVKS